MQCVLQIMEFDMIGKRTKYINQMAVKCIKEAIKDEQFTLEPIDILSLKRIRIDKCEFVLLGDGTFYFYNDEIPTEADFMNSIADYLTFEFNMITHGRGYLFGEKGGE